MCFKKKKKKNSTKIKRRVTDVTMVLWIPRLYMCSASMYTNTWPLDDPKEVVMVIFRCRSRTVSYRIFSQAHEWQRAVAVILIHRTIVTAVPLNNSITQAMLQALNELIPEKSWGILQTFNVPWCSKSPVRVALHTRWNGTITCPICIGNDIDNPVGQALFGDSVTPVRTTITKKVLVGSLKASSSCSVDPQGPHWARGVAVK